MPSEMGNRSLWSDVTIIDLFFVMLMMNFQDLMTQRQKYSKPLLFQTNDGIQDKVTKY